LLKAERDSALEAAGARILHERKTAFSDADGLSVPAVELEVAMPEGMKVFRVTCFVHERSYILSAGGPASDDAMTYETFRGFVASFALIANEAASVVVDASAARDAGPTSGDLHVAGPRLKPARPGEGLNWDHPREDAGR
jgi:hypothetical protein